MCWKCWLCCCCCCNREVNQRRQPRDERTLETKSGWAHGWLGTDMTFIHCSIVSPELIKQNGIDPAFARERVVDKDGAQWQWDRFVFAFLFDDDQSDIRPPKAATLLGFNDNGFMYVVRLPAGTEYMCKDGAINLNKEIGFPNRIPWECVRKVYQWDSNKRQAIKIPKKDIKVENRFV